MPHRSQTTVIDQIPDSRAISAQMSKNLRENRLLRQLLRLAKRVEQECPRREVGGTNTGHQEVPAP
jgi:hypothetical protein